MNLFIFLISAWLILIGCKVGPNYCPPTALVPVEFAEDRPERTSWVTDEDLCHWWTDTFNDPFLDQLLEETILNNFDLLIALEKVFQARENYWVQFTGILPQFESDFQATRFRTSRSFTSASLTPTISPYQSFFQTGLDAIWEIDLWGKLRRTAQSAYYSWQATAEDERGVKITVLSEVANLYVAICYYQTKIGLAKELVDFDAEIVAISKSRFQAGLSNEAELLTFQSEFEGDTASLYVLEAALKQSIYSLAVLLGRPPETLLNEFSVLRPIPLPSGKIPTTLPADLLRRRPDIASAERSLAAQTELIGVAVADLFPSLSLIGSSSSFAANPLQGANVGYSSDMLNKLFKPQSLIWGIGGLVTLPIFDFGKRNATVNIQGFLSNQAYLTYEKTVITALQEVEIALANYFNEDQRLLHLTNEAGYDERNLKVVFDQFQAGLADYIQLLQAKQKWLVSSNAMTDSQQAIDNDLIAIYKALGGDW